MDAIRAALQAVADLTGLDPQDLIQAVRDGQTIEDLLTANGATLDEAVAAAMAPLQAQSEEMLTTLEQRIREGLSGGWQPGDFAPEGLPGLRDRVQQRPGVLGGPGGRNAQPPPASAN